jgi:predicted ATPase/class 3 adenylate cyclase
LILQWGLKPGEFGMFAQPELPSGTVTFLFTDIEKSTVLWERDPGQMVRAMERHDELIEGIVADNSGVLVRPRGEGDSRFAVFRRATDAAAAAAAIQRQFFQEEWQVEAPVRVRIGLHTGEADLRLGDYYGPAVNRCARIRSAAHGGQTLLSMTTASLVQDSLQEGLSLRHLGVCRLANIQRPESIYQLDIQGLTSDFPPLTCIQNTSQTNLPAMLSSFIGRGDELTEIKALLPGNRLVTITGMGGSGKTRLAIQAGAELAGDFNDGVRLVDLSPLDNPELIVKEVANVFDLRENEDRTLLESLVVVLAPKHLLLILDNCEHLLPDVRRITETLIQGAPRLHLLLTSREPLGLPGEFVWSIPPLSFPESLQASELDGHLDYDAVKLFVDRAAAVQPGFKLSAKNAPAILRITRKLEGNPLAIELAAARAKVLSEEDIASRLDAGLRFLFPRGSTPNAPQQTLQAMIDWSYNLLSPKEQVLLRRLGIFKGGWLLPAAEAVCSNKKLPAWQILDLLAGLIDKSLVVPEMQESHHRYRFLEMIREYALLRLGESSEADKIAEKHARYYLALAEESYGELWGEKLGYWLDYLEAEHDNLRSALEWAKSTPDRREVLLRLVGSLWRFWVIRGYLREGRSWMELALERNADAPPASRANAMRGLGFLALHQGDYQLAQSVHEESLALYQHAGSQLGIARQLDVLGEIQWMQGSPTTAVSMFSESLSLHRKINNPEGVATTLEHLGMIARDHGDYPQAREQLEESLQIYRQLGNTLYIASSLNNLGLVAYVLCEYHKANSLFEESVALYRQMKDRWGISEALINLGNVAKDQGYFHRANDIYYDTLALKQDLGDLSGTARSTSGLAEVAFFQGNYSQAIQLAEQSYELFQERGIKRGMAVSLMVWAAAKIYLGELDEGEHLARQGIALSSDIDTPRSQAYARMIYGLSAYNRGDLDVAVQHHREALEIFRRVDDGRSIAHALVNLARSAYRQRDISSAVDFLEESLALSRQLDIRWSLAFSLEIMGLVKRSQGDLGAALRLFKESLQLSVEQANQQGILNCLGAIAGLAALNNQPSRAARLFSASAALRDTMGVKMGANDLREYEHHLTVLHEVLNDEQFNQLILEGCALSLQEAVEQAFLVKAVEEPVSTANS